MKHCISNIIRKLAKELDEDALWEQLIDDYKNKTDKYVVNRDGDYFRIKCPSCKTREVCKTIGPYFVCKQGHFFTLYTEDGVLLESVISRSALGDDLIKGKDSHGHAPYIALKPDDIELVYISKWMENDVSLEIAVQEAQKVWDMVELKGFYSHFIHDVMLELSLGGGVFSPKIDSRIRTWPVPMKTKKWFILANLIEDIGWDVRLVKFDSI